MIQTLQISDLKCKVAEEKPSSSILYMIYPAIVPVPDSWVEKVAKEYGVNVVAVYVPADEWNNYLTPWPEPGETPDSPPFGGKASVFKSLVENRVVTEVENLIGYTEAPIRYLLGVSLSGLFTLWDWMQSEVFTSIACLSGSFWYEGFMDWFDGITVPRKSGKAYFLLGVQEPHAHIKAYRTVGVNTEAVEKRLKDAGIQVSFDWVPGNHFTDPLGRASLAVSRLFQP